MTYLPTQEDLDLLTNHTKHLYSRIDLLNKSYEIIDSIEGMTLSGQCSIDADSDTRRTFTLELYPKKGFTVSELEVEDWIDKIVRVYIGMRTPRVILDDISKEADDITDAQIDKMIKANSEYQLTLLKVNTGQATSDDLTNVYNYLYQQYKGINQNNLRSGFIDEDNIHWYSAGVYVISQNGYTYDQTINKLSISCTDMVALLDGTLGGTLTGYSTKITMYDQIKTEDEDGVISYEDDKTKPHYIRDVIKTTFALSGLSKCLIDYWVRRVPKDMEYSTGETIWSILTELRDLYYPFEMYFDDDTFVVKEIPSGSQDPAVLDSEVFANAVISESASVDYTTVHNCVEVWGETIESDYYATSNPSSDDSDGTGTVNYYTSNSSEWSTVKSDINRFGGDTSTLGSGVLYFKFADADIFNSDAQISFLCPADIANGTSVLIYTKGTVTSGSGDNETTTTVEQLFGPIVVYEACPDINGNDVPQDTSVLEKGKYYVIKYGEVYMEESSGGRWHYAYDTLTNEYKKVYDTKSEEYVSDVKQTWNEETQQYDTVYYITDPSTGKTRESSEGIINKEARVYYLGQSQSHAMAKFVDSEPTASQIAQDKIDESCDNLEYIVVNDPTDLTGLYNSRFTIDKIGRRNLICSGGEYDDYSTDESAMEVCKYMLWKNCRLTDTVTLEMLLIPWLDVNQKIKYAARYLRSDVPVEQIIKQISYNLGEGTMSVTMSRYFPYYPYIVENKYVDTEST